VDPLRFIESSQEEITAEKGRTMLFAVGDIMLDRGVEIKVKESDTGWEWPFLKIKEEFENADVLFGNLESLISDKGKKQGSIYSFRADKESVEGLAFSGFDVLSLANNHMLDYQGAALAETMDILAEHGIEYVGSGLNEKEAFILKVVESNGNKIGFLAYTNLGPEAWKAGEGMGIAWIGEEYEGLIRDSVKRAKKMVDVLAVSVHAGVEYSKEPDSFQIDFSKFCIDQGADLVIGHHPHVTQGTEEYGQGFIAYSLGNFVFDQDWSEETMKGLMLKVLIENGKIKETSQALININESFQPELAL
jgi:poly-gamma-glutamate synthesis protein (capsule biosynthesis protein)